MLTSYHQNEIQNAFKQKAKALNDVTRKYEQLKSEKMAAQTMNAASDEAEQMVQHMAGNHFNGRFDAENTDGSGGHVDMRRMHSMQRHPVPGRVVSRGFVGREYSCILLHRAKTNRACRGRRSKYADVDDAACATTDLQHHWRTASFPSHDR